MGIDVNNLLAEVKVLLGIGDEEWNADGITGGITEDLAIEWINQHIFFLVNKYKFQFLQKIYSTTDTSPPTISLNSAGTDLRITDDIISIESGTIGTSTMPTLIEVVPLRDLQTYQYQDTNFKSFCYWTFDADSGTRILRFNVSQAQNGTIALAVLVYPPGIECFPKDFTLWFKYMLMMEGLLHKQSNNLGDVLERYQSLATAMEKTLADRYAGSSHQNYKVVTPHLNTNYKTWLSMGRAR